MFEGFTQTRIETSSAAINLVKGGEGPPLLLLHGYPQTHVMWHKVAPAFAAHYTVVVPDLRGYGDSGKPASDDFGDHCKRASAKDQVEVMAALGFDRFHVVGHDRGARVGHRMRSTIRRRCAPSPRSTWWPPRRSSRTWTATSRSHFSTGT